MKNTVPGKLPEITDRRKSVEFLQRGRKRKCAEKEQASRARASNRKACAREGWHEKRFSGKSGAGTERWSGASASDLVSPPLY
jgi:hypothetical protein